MENQLIDFDVLRTKALSTLYNRYTSPDPNAPRYATTEKLFELVGYGSVAALHDELVQMRAETLADVGLIPNGEKSAYTYGWCLTLKGARQFIESARGKVKLIDPTEDEWVPLPLDRESIDYKNAVQATQIALNQIEQSNGYNATAPEERNATVRTIKGALESLADGWITRSMVKYSLLSPLKYIATKFTSAAIGEAAKTAVIALLHLFKSWL